GRTINHAIAAAQQARRDAEQAADDLERAGARREDDLSAAKMRAEAMGALLDRFQGEMANCVNVLDKAAHGLEQNADSLGSTAGRAKSQVAAASSASDETTAKVTTVAEAGNDLARTITDISDTVTQSSRLAGEAVKQADTTNQTINELATVAAEI